MNYSENMLPAASSQSRATYMAARQKPREMAKAAPLSLAAAHSAVTTLAPMTSRATMHSALKWQRRAPGISRSISVFVTIRIKVLVLQPRAVSNRHSPLARRILR